MVVSHSVLRRKSAPKICTPTSGGRSDGRVVRRSVGRAGGRVGVVEAATKAGGEAEAKKLLAAVVHKNNTKIYNKIRENSNHIRVF